MIIETNSPQETFEVAKKLAGEAKAGDIYALSGDLGAGKTLFTQGFAKGLGIDEIVNSPTFTILQIYESGVMPLFHFDVYRIADIDEMDEIGYEEYFYSDGVCIIEWASMIEELLPLHYTKINISRDDEKGFDYRKIEIKKV